MKRLVIPVLWAGSLAGCTDTLPVPADIARQAPAERVLAAPDGEARITIVRDAGFLTSLCRASVSVNGARVARLAPEERVTFGVGAGIPVLIAVVQDGGGLCTWWASNSRLEVRLWPEQHRFYRIAFTRSGRIALFEDAVVPASMEQ